ncbi:hypothetical protein QQS21_002328 [Conoideocrella luteorostrata]|uniref:Uncharacterized protein n=1 Tax=Conoideocrella luteorostrata TaxID=1105319 RepID=A0AAJ0CVA5_9HYPO|nr:hypothetical protein QQS21_002328 [Conoideocrella luteorostrata]
MSSGILSSEPQSANSGCIIISAFIAAGKSYLAKHATDLNYNVIDLDSSLVPKEERLRPNGFKESYTALVEKSIAPNTIILLSTHEEIRSALVEQGRNYALVYPNKDSKDEWIERLHCRKSPESLINNVQANWLSMLDECENQGGCVHFTVKEGTYLSDMIGDIIRYTVAIDG